MGSVGLLLLGLIVIAFYIVGLYKMGLAAGLLAFISTALSFVFIWPIGIVVLLAIAGYGLLPRFPTVKEAAKPARPMALPWWPRA
jgi:hypothetical protein